MGGRGGGRGGWIWWWWWGGGGGVAVEKGAGVEVLDYGDGGELLFALVFCFFFFAFAGAGVEACPLAVVVIGVWECVGGGWVDE